MRGIVTDTHPLLWYLFDPVKLSAAGRTAFLEAEARGEVIHVPSIVVVELRYLVDKGKLGEVHYEVILQVLRDSVLPLKIAALDIEVADKLISIPREIVPDMPDRIIAATALKPDLPLVTKDEDVRKLTNVVTIW